MALVRNRLVSHWHYFRLNILQQKSNCSTVLTVNRDRVFSVAQESPDKSMYRAVLQSQLIEKYSNLERIHDSILKRDGITSFTVTECFIEFRLF